MSDENENDDGQTALDHLFNAIGHLGRAFSKSKADRAEARGKGKKKLKVISFDEAPAAEPKSECCVAKRGE